MQGPEEPVPFLLSSSADGYRFGKQIAIINIRDLSRFESDAIVDEKELLLKGLVKKRNDGIKLLGQGEISHPLEVKLTHVSKTAKEKIEAAGGSIETSPATGD